MKQPHESIFAMPEAKLVEEHGLGGPEMTVALRKLVEAKDCAVLRFAPRFGLRRWPCCSVVGCSKCATSGGAHSCD